MSGIRDAVTGAAGTTPGYMQRVREKVMEAAEQKKAGTTQKKADTVQKTTKKPKSKRRKKILEEYKTSGRRIPGILYIEGEDQLS